MRATLAIVSCLLVWLAPDVARACGGGFGAELGAEQTIVTSLTGGEQTYIFQPSFCGDVAEFGIILPVPGGLLADPAVASPRLVDELDELTAPAIQIRHVSCDPSDGGAGGFDGGADASTTPIDIIDAGEVGIFDWVEVAATDASALTTWLDERSFPYDESATAAFRHYVEQGWRFVAFTIRPDAVVDAGPRDTGPPGSDAGTGPGVTACGDLDPVQVVFPTETLVVPARIASSHSAADGRRFDWRIFAFADARLRISGLPSDDDLRVGTQSVRFAGMLGPTELRDYPAVADFMPAGGWLTEIEVAFQGGGMEGDLSFEPDPETEAFRQTEIVYECGDEGGGGCAVTSLNEGNRASAVVGWLSVVALLALRRRR